MPRLAATSDRGSCRWLARAAFDTTVAPTAAMTRPLVTGAPPARGQVGISSECRPDPSKGLLQVCMQPQGEKGQVKALAA